MVTGTNSYQELFQGLLAERVDANGENSLVPIVKLANENLNTNQINALIPSAYDYVSLSYTGSNLTGAVFKTGGSGGTTIATLVITYNVSDDIETVTRT